MNEAKKKMLPSYSLLRVIACLFVVLHHYLGAVSSCVTSAAGRNVLLLVDHILMCNNGLFFMLSGKFALERETDELKDYYKSKARRILLPFLIASFFYYIIAHGLPRSAVYWKDFFVALMGNGIVDYLWFVYALIGFYLAAPFFGKNACADVREREASAARRAFGLCFFAECL